MRSITRCTLLAATMLAAACGSDSSTPVAPLNPDPATNTYAPELGVTLSQFTRTSSGLYIRDDTTGTGAAAATGDSVNVHYTGWLTSGSKFDSSVDRNEPYSFKLGVGRVIRGWDEGVVGMKIGGTRTLVIPPTLGYGAGGSGPIPPNAVLVFRIKLLAVVR